MLTGVGLWGSFFDVELLLSSALIQLLIPKPSLLNCHNKTMSPCSRLNYLTTYIPNDWHMCAIYRYHRHLCCLFVRLTDSLTNWVCSHDNFNVAEVNSSAGIRLQNYECRRRRFTFFYIVYQKKKCCDKH